MGTDQPLPFEGYLIVEHGQYAEQDPLPLADEEDDADA